MSVFRLLASPKKSIAAAVDMVVDRLNDKYKIEFEIKGSVRIVDIKPGDAPAKELK
jgi:hypothetical protein